MLHKWLRRLFNVTAIASALAATTFFATWLYVRLYGPLERQRVNGAVTTTWGLQTDGIVHVVERQPPGGIPPVITTGTGNFTTLMWWPTRVSEWFWFSSIDRTERHFTPPVPDSHKIGCSNKELRGMPGLDVTFAIVWIYPGRISATLVIPFFVWLGFWILARARRLRLNRQSFRLLSQQGRCRRCGYDMRATPRQCPECGYLAPTPLDADALDRTAAKLSDIR